MRVSGVQAKLPVKLEMLKSRPSLSLGVLNNSCSHIIKYQSATFSNLVENEWATMELARRAGFNVATVRMIESRNKKELFGGRALLIERYDIPDARELEEMRPSLRLALQEDAASLTLLTRLAKYDTSAEKITSALLGLKLSEPDLWSYLSHLIFSWLVGNGDLHAKNISVIRWLTPGRLGGFPELSAISYSPIYDLVNTKIYFPGEKFAFKINGRDDKLKKKDFAAVAERWGGSKTEVGVIMSELASNIQANIEEVVELSGLPAEQAQKYKDTISARIQSTLG